MAIMWKTPSDGRAMVEFEGAVLSTQWGNRFLCSDYMVGFYATVWTGRERAEIMVGTDEGGLNAVVDVDATPELLAEIARVDAERAEAERKIAEAHALLRAYNEVRKGDAVVVVKGRKVAKGTRGVVAWMGTNGYGTSVGLSIEGVSGLTFTAITNVKRDHSDDAQAREIDAAHESALWYAANVQAPKATLKAAAVAKGDKVTPKAGRYAGKLCRVIWAGVRDGAARVGVVPATKGRFDADWLALADALGGEGLTFQGLRGRTL